MELLLQDLDKLNYMIEHASSKSKKRDYIIIYKALLNLFDEIENKETHYTPTNIDFSFLEKLEISSKKRVAKKYCQKDYKDLVNIICKNGIPKLTLYNNELYFKDTIKFNTAKEIILDFYSAFNPQLYPIIKQVLDNDHLFIINDELLDGDGYSICNPYSNNSYITMFINEKLKLNNISCLVHEIGHIISFLNYKTNPRGYIETSRNSFGEVPSFTFEFLFLNFLIKNKIYAKDAEKVINNNLCTLSLYLSFLKTINKTIDKLDVSKCYETKELQYILKQENIIKNDFYCELCFSDIIGKYMYSYGELIALYYLSKYRLDEEKTKYNIMSFIANIGIYDDFDMMNKFGINLEELKRCEYVKEEINRNQKQLRKTTQF